MKLINNLITYFKLLKIYTQNSLTKKDGIKTLLSKRTNNITRMGILPISILIENQKTLSDYYQDLQRLLRDTEKIKRRIAFTNVFFNINKYIFRRESLKKETEFLESLQTTLRTDDKVPNPLMNNFYKGKAIETIIKDLSKEIRKIDKKLSIKNTSILTGSLIKLSEDYK